MRIWDCLVVEQPNVVRTFHSVHSGVISGAGAELHTVSEGTVKVWDLTNQYLKLNIKTSSTVNSTLTFHPHKVLLCSTEVSPQVGSSAGI